MASNNRIDRISEEVMRCLSEILPTVKDPRLQGPMLSIVRCDVSGDLRWCKVYLSVLGDCDKKQLKQGLKSVSGFLRRELAHRLMLRYTPELVFVLDDSISHGVHISEMLSKLNIKDGDESDEGDGR